MAEEAAVPEWAQALPEPLHGSPFLKDAATPEAFVDEIKNAAAHMGNSLRIPSPDAAETDVAQFQSRVMEKVPGLMKVPDVSDPDSMTEIMGKLGTPANASGYKLPEGLEVPEDAAAAMKEQAHAIGLTQTQFAKQVTAMTEQGSQQEAATTHALESSRQALKEEWGLAFADRMGEVAAFLKNDKSTPPEMLQAFAEDRLDGATLQWLHNVAVMGSEAGQAAHQEDGAARPKTPAELQSRVDEITEILFSPGASQRKDYAALIGERDKIMSQLYD